MAHYKTMFEATDMLFAHDLGGREVTVEIAKVYAGELMGEKGRKTRKPFLVFAGKSGEKKLALNKTNGKTVAKLYGTDTDKWIGKRVTLYPTTTDFGGETVDCIRIKPTVPKSSAQKPVETKPADIDQDGDDVPMTDAEIEAIRVEEARAAKEGA